MPQAISQRRLPVIPLVMPAEKAPEVTLSLDTLWLQLTGTLCDLACRHCFVSCGPHETRVPMMSSSQVHAVLAEGAALGVRDVYLTGGEPMLHPDFWALCQTALQTSPLTVLTNGLSIDGAAARRARELFDGSRWSFDLRISLDGIDAETNDSVRGRGTFDQVVAGLRALAEVGLSPAITVVEHRAGMAAEDARRQFLAFAVSLGLTRPRVKFMPLLHIGRETQRTGGYSDDDIEPLSRPLETQDGLVCATARLVAATGVYTCPILLDAPDARLGDTLASSLHAIKLRWAACRTCVVEGLSCHT